jgi:hypothetical protein
MVTFHCATRSESTRGAHATHFGFNYSAIILNELVRNFERSVRRLVGDNNQITGYIGG